MVGLNGGFPWLGGRIDPGNSSNFVWSDGTTWDYTNWAKGQPSYNYGSNIEDCVHLFEAKHLPASERHKWNDEPCSHKRNFVCKKGTIEEKNNHTVTIIRSHPTYSDTVTDDTTMYLRAFKFNLIFSFQGKELKKT